MLPLEIFWILTPQSFLFWASESFRHSLLGWSLQGAKKISFTAYHSGNLKLALTSPDVISTSPKNVLTSIIDFTVLLLFKFLKNITCPVGKLKTEFTSLMAKSTSPGLSETTSLHAEPCKSADHFIKVNFHVERKGYDSLHDRHLKGKELLVQEKCEGCSRKVDVYNAKNSSHLISSRRFPPSLLKCPSHFSHTQNPLSLPFQMPAM